MNTNFIIFDGGDGHARDPAYFGAVGEMADLIDCIATSIATGRVLRAPGLDGGRAIQSPVTAA